jgi:hypothetical protein
MSKQRPIFSLLAIAALALFATAVCNVSDVAPLAGPQGIGAASPAAVSQARLNASRLMAPGSIILFDLMQQDLTDCTERRCDPLGFDPFPPADPGCPLPNTRWTSRINGPVLVTPDTFSVSEYDWLYTTPSNETEVCLGIRATSPDPHFSHLEFNVRAVNPRANGHVPGTHYDLTQANFASNDDVVPFRSLLDLNPATGGDVAMFVAGINFSVGGYNFTQAFMNTLGPEAWLVFLRDNANQSGRFFAISGALKGAPRAFADTPSPLDDGFFQSAQVSGDNFDARSEPQGFLNPLNFQMCAGTPTVGRDYAFIDVSNLNEFGFASPGEAGFLFVMRQEAFRPGGSLAGVVINPNGPVGPIVDANKISAPASGYNEPVIPQIVAPDEDNFLNNGPPGVHEMAISVFFVHSTQ